ncbi:MAG: type II secretion system protein [Candidatus Yanofskybacteria bacterium]|nr:type II secretion system protein [Candidatus Yanofskybacteria bacterium]
MIIINYKIAPILKILKLKILKFKIENLKLPQTNAGFTLVELLVAIFLFGLAFTATTSILVMNLRSATAIRDNFIASGLSQEGLEIARNIRDRDWFLGNPFGTSIPDGTYRVQWDSQAMIALDNNPNLTRDVGTGLFSYVVSGNFGEPTIFKRSLEIETVIADVEKKITVNVVWTERGGASKSLSAEEHLFNWR